MFTAKEKQVVGILSIGTFIEYFDLYLFLHFATVLNKIYFAPTDQHSEFLLTSFAYCSAYAFRPFSALIVGWIGDNYGRKTAINVSMTMMSVVCLGIYFLPTYDQIGLAASVIITILRVIQGISTMGEIKGGEVYLVEYLKGKKVFIAVSLLTFFTLLSCQLALYGIKLSLDGYYDYRYLFLAGMLIFVVGIFARQVLAESPEFVKLSNSRKRNKEKVVKLNKKSVIAAIFMETLQPAMFFICFVGLNNMLRADFGLTESEIVTRNLYTVYSHIVYGGIAILAYNYVSPYTFTKVRVVLAGVLMFSSPVILNYSYSYNSIVFIQMMMGFLCFSNLGIMAIVSKNLPVGHRFKVCAMSYALAKALVTTITAFGIILLQPRIDNYVLPLFSIPFLVFYYYSMRYFAKLDDKNKNGLLKAYKKKV